MTDLNKGLPAAFRTVAYRSSHDCDKKGSLTFACFACKNGEQQGYVTEHYITYKDGAYFDSYKMTRETRALTPEAAIKALADIEDAMQRNKKTAIDDTLPHYHKILARFDYPDLPPLSELQNIYAQKTVDASLQAGDRSGIILRMTAKKNRNP